jgi:RNA polymerase sigma-70 factor (ECF subfamily)
MLDLGDPELVAHAQGGNVDAIEALYDRHRPSIFRYVWSRVGDRHTAEDLTGDVFMRMLTALPGYRSNCRAAIFV